MSHFTLESPIKIATGFDLNATRRLMFACNGLDIDKAIALNAAGQKVSGAAITGAQAVEFIAECLHDRADPNASTHFGNTPLIFLALRDGEWEEAEALIDAGAKVAQTNEMGGSAVHVAIETGNASLAEYLERRGADMDLRDTHGISPRAARARIEQGGGLRGQLKMS